MASMTASRLHTATTTPVHSTVWQNKLMSKLKPSSNWANEMLMKLVDECRSRGLRAPNFQECSDRRGGRTAWSSVVEVNGCKHQARYWYDGDWVNNAREDAAEVALQRMGVIPAPRGPHARLLGSISA
ncbi:hypothetical protein D6D25_04748 [Aureobasidium pullulans]|nr:hypothetical protein D6D25_04748 [Aureobasidium pullulans]